MRYALTERSARSAEERAVSELGLSLAELMRRAGSALADAVQARVPYGAVAIVCGAGNNGGDGWVAARALSRAGRETRVFTARRPEDIEGIAGDAAAEAVSDGVGFDLVDGPLPVAALHGYAAVIDALFGIGFSGPLRQPYSTWIDAINATDATIFAADMPSGVETDTGQVDARAVRADVTVTFSAPKVGSLLYPGAGFAGELMVADVGIPWEYLGAAGDLEVWDPADYAALLPQHGPDIHKNSRGRVLIVAGSGAFPGAAVLAAMGAQRTGAGYVTLAVPESVAPIAQMKLTSAVVLGLPENPSRTLASKVAEEIIDTAREYDAVVVGPGITLAHGAILVVRKLVSELAVPLVLDADGLNAMVDAVPALQARAAPTVITPHPGELARLLDITPAEVQADRLSYGTALTGPRFACVLKGAHTIVSGRGRHVVSLAGGRELATAGTGDVLAGMVGALLAQGLEPFEAGALAVHLHGRAGEFAAARLTNMCVIAEDLPTYLPTATADLLGIRETTNAGLHRGSDE
ncbi:MAG: bifunctional ADP-dependent NAD(P)H-hydrate dehydratase/NAD(P)H-hydrate epimerase [Actinobacteria bacterium HGW-Actinobacteria-10]|jgi:NAD(P)H-hydrate epimerase|nr:MAG: bifunctional ADP-dependent NAD(P)H-hydrate dehydratase/NAD(P)H-hydrate epimerase [Actinobacteria bacterium HGW-Actinobacteria-10]